MLIDKYLPRFHYSERHSVTILSDVKRVAACLENLSFKESRIINFLFWLRGMPRKTLSFSGLTNGAFVELAREADREIVIGLAGQFWKPNGNLQKFTPDEFIGFNRPDFLKAVWNFEIEVHEEQRCTLATETRIYCTTEKGRKKFSRYWFFVKPFSGLIRMEILRGVKRAAELQIGSNQKTAPVRP